MRIPGLIIAAILMSGTAARGADSPDFAGIRAIFEARCVSCHGDRAQRKGELDLRTIDAVQAGGESGPVIVAGDPEKSLLWEKIIGDEMPPEDPKLSPAERESIRRWISHGMANAPARATTKSLSDEDRNHWAFIPPKRPPVPAVQDTTRVANPIDAFLLAKLEPHGLSMAGEADPRTLARRLSFDLTGLPPTGAAATESLTIATDGYEKMVDRLLASPHFGERWARHWLDVAGYADSEGYLAEDRIRPTNYRYRDYVIRAFNDDKPFDRFLTEQLAGDELVDRRAATLSPADIDAIVATGFLRQASDPTRDDFVYPRMVDYNWRTLDDTMQIVGSSLLGLSIQCAKCHSHKYEPIDHEEYYRLQAVFMGGFRPGNWPPQYRRATPLLSEPELAATNAHNARVNAEIAREQAARDKLAKQAEADLVAKRRAEIPETIRGDVEKALATEATKRTAIQKYLAEKFETHLRPQGDALTKAIHGALPAVAEQIARHDAELARLRGEQREIPEARSFYDLPGRAVAQLLKRGDFKSPAQVVEPGAPAVLTSARDVAWRPEGKFSITSYRRLEFARWLTAPDHPLTARVMVNRMWSHYFGKGLVDPPDNFGRSGQQPSHPELLDWLATELVRQDWRLKSIHRLIVTSNAYRQRSRLDEGHRELAQRIDPAGRLLSRRQPKRLDGESIRDAMLAASGTLNREMFGPAVPIATTPDGEFVLPEGPTGLRRSIYAMVRRSQPVTLLSAFDSPVMERNCTQRSNSTVCSQALALINGGFPQRQAIALAARALARDTTSLEGTGHRAIASLFDFALGRAPTEAELARFAAFLGEQAALHEAEAAANGQGKAAARRKALTDAAQMLLCSNEFLYLD